MCERLLLVALAALPSAASARDNVLILLADDVGVDQVACYGEGPNPADTPNLDALARRGVLFRNAWAAPICSATRAQIVTGRYGFRTGIGHVVTEDQALELAELTLPEALDMKGGFAHAAFGKWHLGNDDVGGDLSPNLAGWDHFAGTLANFSELEEYDRWIRVENGTVDQTNDYSTTRIVDDFLDWHAAVDEPWLALVAFHAAHEPLHAPPSHLHTVTLPPGDPRENPVPHYRAAVEALDTEIGRLLAGLGPDLDETHVLFLSDNGTIRVASQPPFLPAHAKMTPYEGGLNVPLIVAGPAVVSGGREVEGLVSTTDVFGSALELMGLSLRDDVDPAVHHDAVSFLPYLEDPGLVAPPRKYVYQEYFRPSGPGPYHADWRIARDDRYKLIRNRTLGTDELYDLLLDPFETTNLMSGPTAANAIEPYLRLARFIDEVLASN